MELLVAKGLTALGSDITIQELGRQYGVGRWCDFWDVIYLPAAPLFAQNTRPYFIQYDVSHLLPPTTFYCDFDCFGDGHRNHELALARLTEVLRQQPEIVSVSNTWSNTWTFGEISLNITTFIREKTTSASHNPLYQRHPELWQQCRITIERNWFRKISPEEQAHLQWIPISDALPFPATWARTDVQTLLERGLTRRAPDRPDPILWKDPSAGQVGWHAGHFAAFFERAICTGLELARIEARRGGGSSKLSLHLNNPFNDEHQRVPIQLLHGSETNTLNDIATRVSAFWELPLRIADCLND